MTVSEPLPPPGLAPETRVGGRSRIVGDLRLDADRADAGRTGPGPRDLTAVGGPGRDDPVDVIIELDMTYPGGLGVVAEQFDRLWEQFVQEVAAAPVPPAVMLGKRRISRKLYQCVVTRLTLAQLMALDRADPGRPGVIFRAWPDYPLYAQIDRSSSTVQSDAARRAFDAGGAGVVWAVIDTGIDSTHPHFSELELAHELQPGAVPGRATGGLHRDFSNLVQPGLSVPPITDSPLTDEDGHGTHVAGIIAGACPTGRTPHVASSEEAPDGGFVPRLHGLLQGMAPSCELVSLKTFRRIGGVPVTSSAAVICALEYILTEVNVSRSTLRIHGVNLSLGCDWDPSHYAAGQSPLCQLINEVVDSGVNVVVSAGNNGQAAAGGGSQAIGVLASITEPAHAWGCVTVGSTHRDAPHVFGVSWTSSKGPTLDGRAKPDVVAPGEWICSAATGVFRRLAQLDGESIEPDLTYAEHSGTSMAAPHVSGVIAGFLSSRPEYIGRPADVKALLTRTATDLGRDRFAQGAGLVDAMRMLSEG